MIKKLFIVVVFTLVFSLLIKTSFAQTGTCEFHYDPQLPIKNYTPEITLMISNANPENSWPSGDNYKLIVHADYKAYNVAGPFTDRGYIVSLRANENIVQAVTTNEGMFYQWPTENTHIVFQLFSPRGELICQSPDQEVSSVRYVFQNNLCTKLNILNNGLTPDSGLFYKIAPSSGYQAINRGVVLKKWDGHQYVDVTGGNTCQSDIAMRLAYVPVQDSSGNNKWQAGKYRLEVDAACNLQGTAEGLPLCTVEDININADGGSIGSGTNNSCNYCPFGTYISGGDDNPQTTPPICKDVAGNILPPKNCALGTGADNRQQKCSPIYGCQDVTSYTTSGDPYVTPPCSLRDKSGNCAAISSGLGIQLPTDIGGFINAILGIVLSLSGGIATILIIVSGYRLMVSQGNPEKIQAAREEFTAAIVGLLFVIFSLVILTVIGFNILGIIGFS